MFLTLLFFSTFCFGLEPERKFSEDELFAGAAKLKQYLSTAKAVGEEMKQKLRPDSNMRTVFLVPGIAGSRIQYNYDSSAPSANPACKTSSGGWEDAWVRISALIPITSQCVFTRLSMIFNGPTGWTNQPGVQIQIVGGLDGIMYLDPANELTMSVTSYFAGAVQALQSAGFTNDRIIGAPYDWRVGSSQLGNWRPWLKAQIEQAYENTGLAVLLVSHSRGCIETNIFLQGMTAAWKQKYIHHWIAAGGPIGGAPQALVGFLSGDDLGIETMPLSSSEILLRNTGAAYGLLPVPSPEWNNVFYLNISGQIFGASDLPSFFTKLGRIAPFNVEKPFVALALKSPGVNATIVYGSQMQTIAAAQYDDFNFDTQPRLELTVSGDGTVPVVSATYPLRHWSTAGLYKLELQNVKHLELVSDPNFYRNMIGHATE